MKKIISVLLTLALCLTLVCPVLADSDNKRVVIGADLTDEQISAVYQDFGISRGSAEELTITNAEERDSLSGMVDESLIGTKSISCVYLELLDAGEGLQIEVRNLTWCTQEMILNALVTAGIDDARIIVTAPFDVSGTAALSGIFKAYEDITGEDIGTVAKLVSTQEIIVTAELADTIGSYDAVTIVNELKLILDQTREMDDAELTDTINEIAAEYGITFNDYQISELIRLCRALEKMDALELKSKVEEVQQTIQKLSEAQQTVSGIVGTIQNVVAQVTDFVNRVLSFFQKS